MLRSWVAAQEELDAIVSARNASPSRTFRLSGLSRLQKHIIVLSPPNSRMVIVIVLDAAMRGSSRVVSQHEARFPVMSKLS